MSDQEKNLESIKLNKFKQEEQQIATSNELGKIDEKEQIIDKANVQRKEILSQEQIAETTQESFEKTQKKLNVDDEKKKENEKVFQRTIASISQIKNTEEQIQKIVELAMEKGPNMAVKIAEKLDCDYALDRVHDELITPQVRETLFKKGLLKKI